MNIIEWFTTNVGKRIRFRWTFGGNPSTGEFGQSCGSDDITAEIRADTCKTTSTGGASISIGHCYYCLNADEVAGSSCSESGAYAMVEAGSGNVFHCVVEVVE
jgi:hypothetical protein